MCEEMNKISDLTFRYMKTNIHRTITTIIGVTLSAILIYSIFTCGYSWYYNSLYDAYIGNMGWDAMFVCNCETAKDILTLAPYYGKEPVINDKELKLDYAWIIVEDNNIGTTAVNDFNAMRVPLKLVSGVYPSGKKGVMIKKMDAMYYKYSLGDFISIIDSGETSNDYSKEYGFIDKKICGIMADQNYPTLEEYGYGETKKTDYGEEGQYLPVFYNVELMTEDMYARDDLCVYVTFQDKSDINNAAAKLAECFGVSEYYMDSYALAYLNASEGDASLQYYALEALMFVFAAAVGIFSIFMVRNAFNISVKERSNDYGILRCIGMTRKQIIRIILNEALVIGVIGAILGCLLGHVISTIIFKIIENGTYNLYDTPLTMDIHLYWRAVVYAVICIFVVTCYSMIAPIERLYRLNPIDALRKVETLKKISRRKTKNNSKGSLLTKIFGVEVGYAYNAALRNKGRFLSTVVTLTIGTAFFVAIFNSTNILKNYFIKFSEEDIPSGNFDIMYEGEVEEICNDLKRIDLVRNYTALTEFCIGKIESESYNDIYKRSDYTFMGIDESIYNDLLSKCYEKSGRESGCINVISVVWSKDNSDMRDNKKVGYKGKIEGFVENLNFNVVGQIDGDTACAAIKEILPHYDEETIRTEHRYNYFYCIGDGDVLEENDFEDNYISYYSGRVFVFLDADRDTYKFDNYVYNSYHFYNDERGYYMTIFRTVRSITMVAVVAGALVLLIFLTNIINFQKAQLLVRQEEFSILRSIGMSLKQKRKMLLAENLVAIIFSFIAGNILGYFGYVYISRLFIMDFEDVKLPSGIMGVVISFVALMAIGIFVTFVIRDEDSLNSVDKFFAD